MRLLVLLLVIKVAAGQLTLSNDVELVPAMANMAQITSLDVQCEKSGMTVNVVFSQPFNGIIFSKGHFSNPACRYVRANSGQDSYTFIIPMMDCGTRTFDNNDDGSTGFENMIMIQHEEVVQEIWDTARKITCNWSSRMEKLITFRPFAVDVLPAKNVRYSGDDVMCWMDIQLGKGPFSNTVDGIVKIGDELTVVIYSKDGNSEFDMLVKNCFAYDSEDFEDERTTRIQLSDEQGCLLKPKLMSYFSRTKETGTTGADIIAYASLFAFKFPDKMDVYLSCEVELCKGGCTGMCDDPGFPSNFISKFVDTTTTTRSPPIINRCVTQPGSPVCCARNPSHPSCGSTTTPPLDPCDSNPNSPQCTTKLSTISEIKATTRPDPCLLNPRSVECCVLNPNSPLCRKTTKFSTTGPPSTTKINPCFLNPTSRECCIINPDSPLCRTTTMTSTTSSSTTTKPNPCILNPGSQECCLVIPGSPMCTTPKSSTTTTTTVTPDPCITNPSSVECCTVNPSSSACRVTTKQTPAPLITTTKFDPCIQNPSSKLCCTIKPNSPQCVQTSKPTTTTSRTKGRLTSSRIDPCILNPRSPQCCIRNPSSVFCTTTTTARPDPCDINPLMLQCCTRNPNLPQCTTTTKQTTTTTQSTVLKTSSQITTRPDPCVLNPASVICCARKPFSPECISITSTTRPDPCDLDPTSLKCCAMNPDSPQCITTKISTTTLPSTTRQTSTSRTLLTRRSTASTTTTTKQPITKRITTLQQITSTSRPDPCDLNPGSTECCSRNPNSPGCTQPTSQRLIATTTPSDPCISNPGSSRCCAVNPNHARCLSDKPCSGPGDERPKCRTKTTRPPRTTPNLEFHAFHRWQIGPSTSQRRRRPPYGTRLSAEILAELTNTPRRRRDIAIPPPPPPPPARNVVSMVRGFRVVGANDLAFRTVSLAPRASAVVDSVCVPTATFAVGLLMMSILLITAVLVATFSCLRLRSLSPSKTVEAKNPYYKQ